MPARFGPQKISPARLAEQTGKTMRAWTAILDRWGAARKGHTATARYLETRYGLSGWWAQTVTVQFEYRKGLRKPLAVPVELKRSLARSPRAMAEFERLARSHQREYVEWIAEARRPETRARRAAETIKRLAGSKRPEAGHR